MWASTVPALRGTLCSHGFVCLQTKVERELGQWVMHLGVS